MPGRKRFFASPQGSSLASSLTNLLRRTCASGSPAWAGRWAFAVRAWGRLVWCVLVFFSLRDSLSKDLGAFAPLWRNSWRTWYGIPSIGQIGAPWLSAARSPSTAEFGNAHSSGRLRTGLSNMKSRGMQSMPLQSDHLLVHTVFWAA
jgi:hypothetical protein